MADVGSRLRSASNERDRGQLLLVAGLTIAVILVALVLLLNTVIYTENVATRGLDTETDDALQYRSTVVDSVEEIIEKENVKLLDDFGKVSNNVTNGTDLLRDSLEQRHKEGGAIATFSTSKRAGTHIWQETNADFTGNGTSDWDVVSNVDDVRRFNVTVDESFLTTNASEAFEVEVGGDAISIYSNGSSLIVEGPSNTCTGSDPSTLDFINETVDGTTCPALDFSNNDSIRFINASKAGGTYEITVAENVSYDPTRVPNYAEIVYDANVEIEYQTRDVNYQTTVHVEGAEPR